MKLILECHSADVGQIAHAVIQLDDAAVAKILARGETFRALHAADSEATSVEFSVGSCRFYLHDDNCAEALDEAGESHVFVGDDFEADGGEDDDGERTECDTLVVTENDVWWTCLPKHGDIIVETEPVSFAELAAAAEKANVAS